MATLYFTLHIKLAFLTNKVQSEIKANMGTEVVSTNEVYVHNVEVADTKVDGCTVMSTTVPPDDNMVGTI